MQLGFYEACQKLKYDCELLLTDSTSAPDMIPLAEQALAEPVDGIVFYAVDKSFFPTIAKFKAKGIPVVTPHFTSFDQTESGLTAVVGADVPSYGKAVADALGDKLAGKGTVAVTQGSFNETENLAASSFKDEMTAKYPDVKVLPAQEEGFDQAGAIAKAEAIIAGNPDITGAFSTTGAGPTTWSTAAADTNKNIAIISMETWYGNKPVDGYEKYLRQIVDYTLSQKVIPILATKADNLEGNYGINQAIARVAYDDQVPLWNFWAATDPLPSHGLTDDLFHLTQARSFFDDPKRMEAAWPWRNLTALQSIDAVYRAVSGK
jgi:hypothetical protein